MSTRSLVLASVALLLAIAAFAAPPFDDRWDGSGNRPQPQTAVPGVTEPPHWKILDSNLDATNWLEFLDSTSDPAAEYKWHRKWRQYHPTDNRVAIQIRCEESRCFTADEFGAFVNDPLPAEWYQVPE